MLTFDAQGDDEDHSLNMDHGFHSKLPPGILPHGLPTVKEVAPAITPQEQKKDEVKQGTIFWLIIRMFWTIVFSFTVKELSDEQKQMIILSEDFQRFVLKSGKIMERALSETVDIYADYIGGSDSDEALWVLSEYFLISSDNILISTAMKSLTLVSHSIAYSTAIDGRKTAA